MQGARYCCRILTKFGVCRKIFVKVGNTKFHENSSGGSRTEIFGTTDRQTDGHDEANSRFAIYATTPINNIERGLCVCVCV